MFKKSLITVCFALAATATANAQSKNASGASTLPKPRPVESSTEWKPHVGLMAGVVSPSGSGSSAGEIGVDVGYQNYIPFALGAEFIHSEVDDGSSRDKRNTLMAKASYNFGGENEFFRKTYVALALGAAFTEDGTALAGAPIVGFDYPIRSANASDYFSVGANTRYTFVGNNETDTFSLAGVVKYWY